jgi:hypothetical protein
MLSILADYRGEDVTDYGIDYYKEYVFVDTCGHGYLAIGSDENGYSDALAIARASNFSFVLDGGIVYLEEDCDAPKFLQKMYGVAR